ncbi:MAG: N-acetylmuramoyl-L-alanine amidase [Candidatus Babeliales bacterium]
MKTIDWVTTITVTLLFIGATTRINCGQTEVVRKISNEPNCLNWVEVTSTPISKQVMFDFSSPIFLEKSINKATSQLRLVFPGMRLGNSNMSTITAQFDKLKADGFIEDVAISQRTEKVPAVVVALTFAKSRNLIDPDTQTSFERPNKMLIRWSKIDNPYRLVLDIFSKEDLDTITHKEALFLHASNDAFQSDNASPATAPFRIVIDAGHGASDMGAKGFYDLIEKNLTLDIAKQVQALLEKKRAKVTLTREWDKEISLQGRAELAAQLKAHLFVSIHVNSAGKLGSPASGIETFYLDSKELLPPSRTGGFMFVNLAQNNQLIDIVDTHLKNNLNLSKNLALCIQKNILSTLAKADHPAIDRGIKPAHFRVLFQNAIPSALAEVGFITNKDECKLLAQPSYRKQIAQSITQGINTFLTSYY